MITVSADEYKAMNFSAEFGSYARSLGIRDPFKVQRQLFAKRCKRGENGDMIVNIEWDETTGKIKEDPDEPSSAEIESYIKMRDEYIARRCFNEIGYDSFLAHTRFDAYSKYNVNYMRDWDEFVPCKSIDKQCNMFCKKFAECTLKGIYRPE